MVMRGTVVELRGLRTPDPLIANEVLSQLSYSPVPQGADNAQRPSRKSSGAACSCHCARSEAIPIALRTTMEIAAHALGLSQRVAALLA